MSELPPDIQVEIHNEDKPELDDRGKVMRKIVSLTDEGHFAAAQTLVEETGIRYSEAVEGLRTEE